MLKTENYHRLPDWMLQDMKHIEQGISCVAAGSPIFEPLIVDATSRGRKLRSSLVLSFLRWNKWDISAFKRSELLTLLGCLELLHSASCIVDDLIDGDSIRRGVDTFHQRNGRSAGMLSPLMMLSLVFKHASINHKDILLRLLECTRLTIEGEAVDTGLVQAQQLNATSTELIEQYLMKTTPFFGVGHEICARIAGKSQITVERSYQFGMHLGAYYQLANDFHDTFSIDFKARGSLDEMVLVAFNPAFILNEIDSSEYMKTVGSLVQRSQLESLADNARHKGSDKKLKNLILNRRNQVLDSCKGEASAEIEQLLDMIDTKEFWSYKYGT